MLLASSYCCSFKSKGMSNFEQLISWSDHTSLAEELLDSEAVAVSGGCRNGRDKLQIFQQYWP